MPTHDNLKDLFNDIAQNIIDKSGLPDKIKADDFPAHIDALDEPTALPVGSTTVRVDANNTQNIVSNDRCRILGSDGHFYTLEQWNAMFVAAGYDHTAMAVTPKGLSLNALGCKNEAYLFERYMGQTWDVGGNAAGAAGKLPHGMYNNNLVTGAGSGTDYTTNKQWSVTDNGDGTLTLYTANTGQSWTIAKDTGYAYAHKAFNIAERIYSLWAQNEWMRHRMAIAPGLPTNEPDGTIAEVGIFDINGNVAAVGADMYFYIKENGSWIITGQIARYNLNNRHTVAAANLTSAIADAIYNAQVSKGINMNDTGINSASKPTLAPGAKGAEAIAYGGYWYIITPFISIPNANTATANVNIPDSPAVYWAINKGVSLPSDSHLWAMYNNWTMVTAYRNYLVNVEGWTIDTIPANDYIWTAVRASASVAWIVYLLNGYWNYYNTVNRYFVCGASAS